MVLKVYRDCVFWEFSCTFCSQMWAPSKVTRRRRYLPSPWEHSSSPGGLHPGCICPRPPGPPRPRDTPGCPWCPVPWSGPGGCCRRNATMGGILVYKYWLLTRLWDFSLFVLDSWIVDSDLESWEPWFGKSNCNTWDALIQTDLKKISQLGLF